MRAWDLMRYQTVTRPSLCHWLQTKVERSSVLEHAFQIYVWSMKAACPQWSRGTGSWFGLFSYRRQNRAPVDVFEGKGRVENFTHTHDVLIVVYCPDGKQLGCSTLDGQIHFWDQIDGVLMGTIEGRHEVAEGRLMSDRRTAANSSSGKCVTRRQPTACWRNQQVHLHVRCHGPGFATKASDISQLFIGCVDDQVRGKLAQDAAGPIMCTKCVRISPTGSSGNNGKPTQWTTLFLIPVDVEPEAINDALESKRYSRALMLALRLNELLLIQKCVEAVDISVISAVVCNISLSYLGDALAQYLEKTPHLEFLLELCIGRTIQLRNRELMPTLKSLSCSNNCLQK
ncbi:hypothetical protein SELMODRAFT_426343 [Selaginella moellendorffii]|uniref:Small-subunit processome Utp12 domain-containing protein n=1 Tax=Selaginella moellendorffii TaxID=88036 RepID=D8SW31_SELML|nr:hypothetical protein SELMODRAFT_426343 [Selaginella moellendorffii]